ncbi:S-adenosylmethionine:tRNA ribosyltransferase-isomerase, partial [Sedimentitalea sp. XS_ASV28]|uniref:S-adenosylmethionine:tRNA ribosyltransferase-isomerase n=1 Tax=Sedimentitalea sp. XS_ASV28 TaxID=3241296 RepID=UPI003512E387
MKLSDFDFDLPEDRIATRPAVPRSAARVVVAHAVDITETKVSALPGWLRPGDLMVQNDK